MAHRSWQFRAEYQFSVQTPMLRRNELRCVRSARGQNQTSGRLEQATCFGPLHPQERTLWFAVRRGPQSPWPQLCRGRLKTPNTGVTSTRTRASRSPVFHQSCHAFGSMVAASPWRRMLVVDDLRADARDQLGHCAAIWVLVGKLKNGGALASDGFSQISPISIGL